MLASGTSSSLGLNSIFSLQTSQKLYSLPSTYKKGSFAVQALQACHKILPNKKISGERHEMYCTLHFCKRFLHIHSAEKQICSGCEVKLSICSPHLKVSENHALILNQKCAKESGRKKVFSCVVFPSLLLLKIATVTGWAFDFVRLVRLYVRSKKNLNQLALTTRCRLKITLYEVARKAQWLMSAILLTHNAEQNLDLQYHLILTVAIKKKSDWYLAK